MWNGTKFVDLDWPLNASSLLSASAELLVSFPLCYWDTLPRCRLYCWRKCYLLCAVVWAVIHTLVVSRSAQWGEGWVYARSCLSFFNSQLSLILTSNADEFGDMLVRNNERPIRSKRCSKGARVSVQTLILTRQPVDENVLGVGLEEN